MITSKKSAKNPGPSSEKTALVWGGTGQFKVIRPILEGMGYQIVCLLDQNSELNPPLEIPFYAGSDPIETWLNAKQSHSNPSRDRPHVFVIAIGGTLGEDRLSIAMKLKHLGLQPLTLIHERAWVAASAEVGQGSQILAMASVCEGAVLGEQVIVNTHASVDHDCILGSGVHVMPGATLAGCVEVEENASIGSNATVLPRVKIGKKAVVGAGAVVIKDVLPGQVVVGNPAKVQTDTRVC